ncbi:MAG: DUF4350 domain-containing protein [Firmicutes bacterium]|nr:DUF4350 domain-containing protein [Bacillota bacterium]
MNRKYLFGGIIVLLLIIAVVIMQAAVFGRSQGAISKPTTYDTGVKGHKAFYLLLSKIGYKAERFANPLENLAKSEFRGFLILNPYSTFVKDDDSTKLVDYANKGNKILIAADENNKILENLNVKVFYPQDIKNSVFKGSLSGGVKKVDTGIKARLTVDKRYYKTLLEDEYGVIAASISYDNGGEIVVFSLPDVFANAKINKDDNIILINNLMGHLGCEDVAFDESLHGIINYGGKMELSPVVWAVIAQVCLMIVVFYIAAMKRFGKPRRYEAEVLRTSTEYVRSLSGLFQRAGASGFVVENCLRGLKRKIAGPCRITPETPDKKMLENIRYSNLIDEGIMTSYLEKIHKARVGKDLTEVELVRIYGESDRISNSILS